MPGINKLVQAKLAQADIPPSAKPYRLKVDGMASLGGNDTGLHVYTLSDLAKAPPMPPTAKPHIEMAGSSSFGQRMMADNPNPIGLSGAGGHLSINPTYLIGGLGVTAAVEGLADITGLRSGMERLTGPRQTDPYTEQVSFKITLMDGNSPVWHDEVRADSVSMTPNLDQGMSMAMETAFEGLLK